MSSIQVKIPLEDSYWGLFFGEYCGKVDVKLVSENGEHFVIEYQSKEDYETDLDRLCGRVPMEVLE